MKHFLLPILIVLTVANTYGQTKTVVKSTNKNAKLGETMWVCIYYVKPDKKAQYEKFVHEIFWAGVSKLPVAEQQVFRQTRIMHPEKAEKDGTYAYTFVMDPVIKGADYDIGSLTKKMYGEKQGTKYYKLFKDAVTTNYKQFNMVQSKD